MKQNYFGDLPVDVDKLPTQCKLNLKTMRFKCCIITRKGLGRRQSFRVLIISFVTAVTCIIVFFSGQS